MLYAVLRATAAIALRWYYADVNVLGTERIPRNGPVVIIANHPNALIDALLVGGSLSRRILLTAKATLFESRGLATLLRFVGVVPLRRATDERAAQASAEPSPQRNAETFRLVTGALRSGAAVLVFPEGISHDAPTIAPLKSGAARMALQAREEGTAGLRVLPVGLIYEEKERPGSRVLVRIGEPLDLDTWFAMVNPRDATPLTRELDTRLRAVTLNFASAERAARAVAVSRAFAAIATAPPPLHESRSLDYEAEIARRVDAAIDALSDAPPELIARADVMISRLAAIEAELDQRGASLSEIRISPRLRHGVQFVLREGCLALLAVVVVVLGRLTHWIPLRVSRALAMRSLRGDPSRDQPAMRTILLGIISVIAWYVALGSALALWRGPETAGVLLVVIFAAAHLDRVLRGRLHRAVRRARTYLALRSDPALQDRVMRDIDDLLQDALALEHSLAERAALHSVP